MTTYLYTQRAWALLWLATPERDLPGNLTHDGVRALLAHINKLIRGEA
jgi:hypothetical protein